jgi:hypothetical protein
VTQGNLDNFMPPFAAVLNLQQRWDVLAHVYGLSYDPAQLARGAELYAQYSSEIASVFPRADELSAMAEYSQNEIAASLEEQVSDLSREDAGALAAYLQSVALGANPNPVDVSADPNVKFGSASGLVKNGSGADLPPDLQATLFAYDNQAQVFTRTAPLDSFGRYQFENVPQAEGRTFFVSVDYLGLSYFSSFTSGDFETQFDTITIYETTTDTSQLAVEEMVFVFDFSQPAIVRVVEQVVISNIGDRAVTPGEDGTPALQIDLPPQASNLVFQEGVLGDRYVATDSGFGDLRAVLPGTQSYHLFFAYDLPYSRGVSFPVHMNLPTRSVLLFVPTGAITAGGDFIDAGDQDLQDTTYDAYVSNGAFSAGDETEINLSGPHPLGASSSFAAYDRLLVALAALTASVGAAWFWLRRMQPDPEVLMDQIIALDARHARGDLAKNAYNQQRAVLKEKLRRALKEK